MTAAADVGVFGGSGFYSFLEDVRRVRVDTPYGSTSDEIALGTVDGVAVAFMARHGAGHAIPAHAVNYRANVWAFQSLGVTRVIGPCAAGSLRTEIAPGDVVVCDQLVDRTRGRRDTFFDGPDAVHVSFAEPYCPQLRALAPAATRRAGFTTHETGTVVTIQGPRFSTKAESRWFIDAGWDLVNMTQYPEAYLARELGMCYLGLALVTDYDAGIPQAEGPPNATDMIAVFQKNVVRLRAALIDLLAGIPDERHCDCRKASDHGRVSDRPDDPRRL